MRPQQDAWPVMGEEVTRSGPKGGVRTGQAQLRATCVRSAGACPPRVRSPLHKLLGVHPLSLQMAADVPGAGEPRLLMVAPLPGWWPPGAECHCPFLWGKRLERSDRGRCAQLCRPHLLELCRCPGAVPTALPSAEGRPHPPTPGSERDLHGRLGGGLPSGTAVPSTSAVSHASPFLQLTRDS